MPDHSKYSPSTLSRLLACPGSSVLVDELIKEGHIPIESESSEYAARGTLLHDCVAQCLLKGVHDQELEPVDEAQVQECVGYAKALIATLPERVGRWDVELSTSLRPFGIEDADGTSDFCVLNYESGGAHVVDWKFGSGVIVNAENNPQLMSYAAGVIPLNSCIETVHLHIVQPAIDHLSVVDIHMRDLINWVYTELAPVITNLRFGVYHFNPGPEQCRWCRARAHCRPRAVANHKIAVEIFKSKSAIKAMDIKQLTKLYEASKDLNQFINDIKSRMFIDLQNGKSVPGYKLVPGRSSREWIDKVKVADWLLSKTTIEPFDSKLLSPAKCEELVKSLKRDPEFQALYTKVEGPPSLAKDTDPRKAVDIPSVAERFTGL